MLPSPNKTINLSKPDKKGHESLSFSLQQLIKQIEWFNS